MRIALDWDGTYTADPELWDEFAKLATRRGHSVTIVTWRSPVEDIHSLDFDVDVVYCSRTAKQKHFDADVWIDDCPASILEDEK